MWVWLRPTFKVKTEEKSFFDSFYWAWATKGSLELKTDRSIRPSFNAASFINTVADFTQAFLGLAVWSPRTPILERYLTQVIDRIYLYEWSTDNQVDEVLLAFFSVLYLEKAYTL